MSTKTRILELLGLLQERRQWPGAELASRLGISARTLRRDVASLQELGYPISTRTGVAGGYQLAAGASLPPLIVDEDEATAIVLGLKEIASGAYPTSKDAALRAMSKVVQVLPGRIRRKIDSLQSVAIAPGESRAPISDVGTLTTLALACRDHETVEFGYTTRDGRQATRSAHPHQIVHTWRRLYLVAYDLHRGDWRSFRLDRISDVRGTGRPFAPRPLPADDLTEFVVGQGARPPGHVVEATVAGPAQTVRERMHHQGEVTEIDTENCRVRIETDSLEWALFLLLAAGHQARIDDPEPVRELAQNWASRLSEAIELPR